MATLVVPGVRVETRFDVLPPLPAPSGVVGIAAIIDRPPDTPRLFASVVVAPNTARAYAATVADPAAGSVGIAPRALVGGTTPATGVDVELSRVHTASGGAYAAGGLAFAGMHLSRTVHVPVRRFSVDLVTTLPLRDAARADAATITTLARGAEAFLLVPAPIEVVPSVVTIAGAPPAPGSPDPVARAEAPDAAAFLGAGAAFRIAFPATAPAGPVVMTVRVRVDASTTADLSCVFDLT